MFLTDKISKRIKRKRRRRRGEGGSGGGIEKSEKEKREIEQRRRLLRKTGKVPFLLFHSLRVKAGTYVETKSFLVVFEGKQEKEAKDEKR